jgi:hypothetical protein
MSNLKEEEFHAYMLLYATHADFEYKESERDFILSKVEGETLERVQKLFDRQNDIERIDTIRDSFHALGKSKNDVDSLMKELTELFNADGDFNQVEHNLLIGLKRILS